MQLLGGLAVLTAVIVWHQTDIGDAVNAVKQGTLFKGRYGVPETNLLRDTLSQIDMEGKRML